jgi:hypothetical protein
MIKIASPEHFAEVLEFAMNARCATKLLERLDFLAQYGGHPQTTVCTLRPDFAPHSFTFTIESDGKHWFNGGLVYSGPDQSLDGSFPALTVGIGIDASQPGWSIHT